MSRLPIRRALISVSDKSGLDELGAALKQAGVAVVSTGSTAKVLAAAGVDVTPVSEVTGFPEAFDGRVKTLHPKVHGGLLADRRKPAHVAQLDELGVVPFDLVVVNLYPFRETVAAGAAPEDTVEQIDIGGRHGAGLGEELREPRRDREPGPVRRRRARARGRRLRPARAAAACGRGVRAHRVLRHRGRLVDERAGARR